MGTILNVLAQSIPHANTGYAMRSVEVVRIQRSLGFDVCVATCPGFPVKRALLPSVEEIDGVRYFRDFKASWRYRLAARIGLLRESWSRATERRHFQRFLSGVAAKVRPELIHVASPAENVEAALPLARRLGVPLVYEVRGSWADTMVAEGQLEQSSPPYRFLEQGEDAAIRAASRALILGDSLRKQLIARGHAEEHLAVTHNGVDTDRFSPIERDTSLAHDLGLPEEALVVGYVTSVRRLEGIGTLLEALARLPAACQVVGVLVGDGPELPELRRLAQSLRLEDRMRFVGRVPHEQVDRYYSLFDVFVVPRLNMPVCRLVTPLKPLEAMAMGIPVLASRLPALEELVIDGQTGFTFAPEDPDELRRALQDLSQRRSSLRAIGEAARRWVTRHRDWRVLRRDYAELYGGLGIAPAS